MCVCVWKAERPKSFDDWWPLDTPGNRRLNYGPINCRPHVFFLLFWVFFSFIGRPLLNEVVPARRHRQAGVSPLIDGRFNGHRQRRADERPNTPIMRRSAGPFGGHWREVKKKTGRNKKKFQEKFQQKSPTFGDAHLGVTRDVEKRRVGFLVLFFFLLSKPEGNLGRSMKRCTRSKKFLKKKTPPPKWIRSYVIEFSWNPFIFGWLINFRAEEEMKFEFLIVPVL